MRIKKERGMHSIGGSSGAMGNEVEEQKDMRARCRGAGRGGEEERGGGRGGGRGEIGGGRGEKEENKKDR